MYHKNRSDSYTKCPEVLLSVAITLGFWIFKASEIKMGLKNYDRYNRTTFIFYAPCCLRQFIVVKGGFLPSCPLTAHLFIVLFMANLSSHNCYCRLYFGWKRVGDLHGGRDAFL